MNRSYLSGAKKRQLQKKKSRAMERQKGSLLAYTVSMDSDSVGNASLQQESASSSNSSTIPDPHEEESLDRYEENSARPSNSSSTILNEEESLDNNLENRASSSVHPKLSFSTEETVSCYKENITELSDPLKQLNSPRCDVFNEDPATWEIVTDEMREYFLLNPVSQNIHLVDKTERQIGEKKRTLTEAHFYRHKSNQQKVKRDWLVLSSSTLTLFCWICKLFSKVFSSSLSTTGYSDWKHATVRLHEHENSYFHRESVCTLIQRKEISCRIDSNIIEQAKCDSKYWFEVLRRVVAVTKFLATRGLPFFGRNETVGSCGNGNFLGCMELISEFDPFLAKHLQKYGNPGSGRTSYLSSTTLNEFIDLMASKVRNNIIDQIKSAKFYSIIVDSTPDLSHTDQLTVIIRYVSPDCEPVERFLTFIPICGHSSEYLENTVQNVIETMGLRLTDCRGQSYDNASNMAGKYTGLQARIKMLNPLADFVPCAAHSLNLVVVKAVECNGQILDFFTFLQELYNFFSNSTHRWKLLHDKMKNSGKKLTLKSRSLTRWCANAAATKALKENYKIIIQVLLDISLNSEESPSTRIEAKSLHKKISKFETAMCSIVWDCLLHQIDSVNQKLQSPQLDLSVVPDYYRSLIEFINFARGKFEEFEGKAQELVGHNDYAVKRTRKTPKSFYDGECAETLFNNRDSFKISCFYVACDTLVSHLTFRMSAYESVLNKFSCLFTADKNISYEKAKSLQEIYQDDLEDVFCDELVHVFPILENEKSISQKLKKIHDFGVVDTFPNVETALKIFLTLPLSNCTGERSFSLLKRIKSPLRNLIADTKLSSLALLSMESDITLSIDYEDVINSFAAKKLRKKHIKNI